MTNSAVRDQAALAGAQSVGAGLVGTRFIGAPFTGTLAACVLVLGATASSGCVAVAAGGIGVMLSQEFQQGAHIVYYEHDAETVWARAKETLAHLSQRKPVFDENLKRAYATVDGGSVKLEVVSEADGRCRMAVKARKYGLQNADLAMSVLDQINEQVNP